MRRTSHANQAQLALIEVAPSPPPRGMARRVVDGARRQRQTAINAHHCQVLLAELDRIANAANEQRVQDLAALYDACERAQPSAQDAIVDRRRSAVGSSH